MRIEYPVPEQERELRRLWALAFGDGEEFIGAFFDTAYSPDRCRCVTVDDQAAACLYWFDTEYAGQRFAYLYAVATHPEYRNQGLCRQLMGDTHALLRQRGYAGAILNPAEPNLQNMYAGMGYENMGTISEFSAAAGKPIPIREIDKAEYASLRRQLLPEGGVIQEGCNLAYFQTYGKFYAGEDFLLAAIGNEAVFHGAELLGNKASASGILGALGYAQGTFRVPGEGRLFAMLLPLTDAVRKPSYLGLVFD